MYVPGRLFIMEKYKDRVCVYQDGGRNNGKAQFNLCESLSLGPTIFFNLIYLLAGGRINSQKKRFCGNKMVFLNVKASVR